MFYDNKYILNIHKKLIYGKEIFLEFTSKLPQSGKMWQLEYVHNKFFIKLKMKQFQYNIFTTFLPLLLILIPLYGN